MPRVTAEVSDGAVTAYISTGALAAEVSDGAVTVYTELPGAALIMETLGGETMASLAGMTMGTLSES